MESCVGPGNVAIAIVYPIESVYTLNYVLNFFCPHAIVTQSECPTMSCIRTSVRLSPSSTGARNPPYACRDEDVTFTCEVINARSLQWASEPDICRNVPFSYTPVDDEGETRVSPSGSFQSNITFISSRPPYSNFSSVLTFTPPGPVDNVTVVCGDQLSSCTSTQDENTINYAGKCIVVSITVEMSIE